MLKYNYRIAGFISVMLLIAPLLQSCATTTSHDITKNQPVEPTQSSGVIPISGDIIGAILLSKSGDAKIVDTNGNNAEECDLISDKELDSITYDNIINESQLIDLNHKRQANNLRPLCTGLVKASITGLENISVMRGRRSPPCIYIRYSFGTPVRWLPRNCM
ncbi:MAG: hypothetical protein V3V18_03140 [Methylococcales bacterium]